jgi:lipopolysaccharide export system protein LptA
VTTYSAQSIVFIDSRVANLQALLDGLQEGETAYVLDPNSDGVEQIADILAANNLTGLASISILGHGESGEIALGSSSLTDSNLASHSNALAELGATLAPGGMIKLYGCDIAFGTTGQQFISDFSTFAGGAPVEASTQPVGSASDGGSWTLNASSNGATTNDANAPFTSAALSSFQGVLVADPVTEIWTGVAGQPQIIHVDDNGTAPGINSTSLYAFNSNFHRPTGVELDPNQQKYFVLESGSGISTVPMAVRVGSLVQALDTPTASPTFTTITLDANSAQNFIPDFAIDTVNHQIYFVDVYGFNTGTNDISKFERINYDGTGLTTLATVATGSNTGVVGFALDLVNHTAVFAVNSGGSISVTVTPASGFLYEATGVSATATSVTMHSLTINGGSTLATSLGNFSQDGGLAIDPTTHNVYFILDDGNAGTAGGVYKYSFTSSFAGSVSAVWQETATTQPRLLALAIDPTTGKWYGTSTQIGTDEIWVGSLSGGAPTTFLTFSNASAGPTEMELDNVPTLSITAVAGATFTESSLNPAASNNPSISLITAATASDSDSPQLVSATVSVGSFFAGDTLSVSTAGTSLTSSYNSSTGKLVLSGLDSFAHYQTALDTVKYGSTSDNPTDFGSDNSRVLSWVVNDGLITSAPQSQTVTVVGVNDPPTLASVASSAHYTEEGAGGVLSSAASVIDVDDLNLSSATVQITGGSFAGDTDVLAASVSSPLITVSYNSATQTLTLSGSDTLAHYQAVLDSVNFTSGENPTNYGSNTTRVVTWQLQDPSGTANGGVSISSIVTTTLTVTNVNDAPTLSNVATVDSFTEGTAITLSSAVTVSDPDNLNLSGATVKISGGTFAGDADVLTATTTGTGITASYNSSTETLTLSGSDTKAHYQQVLDTVVFSSGSNPDDYGSNKTRTVTWVLNDGSGSFNLSTAQTTTISITAINDPPVLSNVAATASYTENAGAQATLSGALTVSDVDSLTLANATVKVVGGAFTGDGDVLSVNGVSGGTIVNGGHTVTVSYNSTTETLTLTGSDTLADYQTLLEQAGFNEPAIDNPTNYGSNPTRTITWLLNDGSGSNNLSSVATTTLSITAINDAPTLTSVASTVNFTEEGGAVTLSGAVTVTDPDNLNLASATVSITGGTFANDGDVLAATTTGTSITASYDSGNERLILSGADTLADYRSVLDSVTFNAGENPTNFGSNPTRIISWVLNDGSGSNNLSTAKIETVSITNVNDAPTLASVAPSASFVEEGGAVTLASTLAVSDPDNLKLANATVAITGGFAGDVLAATAVGSITVAYNSTTETLTLSGADTLANYKQVLDSVTFNAGENPTNFGSNPTRTVVWTVNDGGTSFSTGTATSTITVTNVNDAPTLALGTTVASWTEDPGTPTSLAPAATVTDADNVNLASATVQITGGTFAGDGDVLAASATGNITVSYDTTSETLLLTGSDTLAHYQTVLNSITFNAGENPTDYGSHAARTLTWTLNDGSTSFSLSAAQITTVNITNVNDAPTLSNVDASLTVSPAAVTTISPTLSVSDPDNLTLANATVSITGGTFVGDGDLLAAANTTGTSITVAYNSTTETLTLTGADTLADYQQVLDSITFSSTAPDPTNSGSNPTRTLTWVVNDGGTSFNTSAVQTTTITIQNGPAINPPANANYTEENGSVTLAPALAVTDTNGSTTLVSATVALTGGTFVGDQDELGIDGSLSGTIVNGVGTGATTITFGYDTSSETLTLTGSDTLADYQSALDHVTFLAHENPTNFGSDPTRTVVWTVNDGGTSFATGTATSTINITNVNDAPTLAIGTTVASWTEEQPATGLAPAVTATDADNQKLASATVQITGGTFAGDADVLAASPTGNITVSYDTTSETLLLTGSDTLANYETVLDSITFIAGENPTNFGSDPSRTLTWTLNDGSTSFSLSAAQTTTVNITNVNDAPTLTSVAATVGFSLGQTVTLSPATSVSDPDNLTLTRAIVSVTAGSFASDGDVLAVDTNGTNITASYDAGTETLTLTGSDTLADYQTVLDRVTFTSGPDPSNSGSNPTRTLTWVVNDGGASSNLSDAATTTISVHVGPGIFVPASADYTEEGPATALSPATTLNDTNNTTLLSSATVALTDASISNGHFIQFNVQGAVTGDVLSADTTSTNIVANYDSSTETLTLTGVDSQAHYQQVLDSITFTSGENPTNYGSDPTRTVTWTINDGSSSFSSGTATSTINVTRINDAPTMAVASSASFVEEGAAATLSPAALVSDPDEYTLTGATVQIASGGLSGDVLEVFDTSTSTTSTSGVYTGINVTYSYDSSTQTLTLSGADTIIDYNHVLDNILFTSGENPTNFGSDLTRKVTWQVNDGGGTANGGVELSDPVTTTVSVTNVNDPPTLSNVASPDSFTVGSTITLSPSVTISDPDSLTLASATVSITGGTFASDGDVLSATGNGTIGVSYDAGNERLVLTGTDTFAHYQTVLDSVVFSSGTNPNNFNSNPTRTVVWTVNDGSATAATGSATTTINIAHEPPTLISVAPTLSFTQGNTTAISPSITVSDFDSTTLVGGTVQIAGSFGGDGDVLSFSTALTNVTASYNASTETLTLSGNDTLAHYQSVLDSVKFSSGSDPTNHGSNASRTVTWVVDDGNASLGQSSVQTTTIGITPLDNPPSLSNVAASASYTENSVSPVVLSSALSVTDPDSTTLTSATVSIAGGTFVGDGDVLAAEGTTSGTVVNGVGTSATTITFAYDTSTEALTLTGADTAADYQNVLRTVTFIANGDNPTDYGSDPTRTVTWVVKDDFQVASAAQTTTVSITAINDAPTLSVAPSLSFLEGTTVQLSPTASVSDPDNLSLANATVKITGGTFAGDGDQLAANVAGTHITASYNAATETLTLTSSDPLATYQAVLDSITFSSGANPTNYGSNPTRTVTWVVNDGSGSFNLSTVQTETISITAVNDPPALSGLVNDSYTEEGGAVTLSSGASVSDPDNLTLANATVAIVGGTFAGDADLLSFSTTGTSINASYNSSTETLTLTGSDTTAHYQQVLDSITFLAGENPTNYGSDAFRTVTWVLNDGSSSNNLSTVQTTTVTIVNVNDPPTLASVTSSVNVTEEGGPVILSGAVTITDPDNLQLASATVSITGGTFANDGDLLAATTTGTSINASYDSTNERLILSGSDTLADYQAVLDSVTFTAGENPTNFGSNTTRTITWVLDDGSGSNNLSTAKSETVSITNVNDAPTLSNVAASAQYTEEGAAGTLSSAVTVSDPDNLKLVGATVSITGGTFANDGDVLAANTTGTSITASYDSTNERLVLSGSDILANYRTVLDSVTFSAAENPTNFGSNPTRTVTWVLNDGSGSFSLSTAQTTTVTITNVNDAPALASVAPSANFTEEGGAVTLSSALSVSDPDNLKLANATVSIVGGTFANDGDVLAANTNGTSITASYDSANERLVLSGSDTLADYKAVLDSVTFNAGENPTNFGSNPTRTIVWTVNDGSASSNFGTATTTVSITNVNDVPTLSNVPASAAFTEEGPAVTLASSASVSDPDNLKLANATVKVVGGGFTGDALATNVGGTNITSSYNPATESLVLTGSDTLANYQQVLDKVTFSAGENPTNFGSNPTRTVTWLLNDGSGSFNLSTVVTETISITNVNDAPTLTSVVGVTSYTENAAPTTVSPSLSVSDPDNLTLANATVSISNTFAGDGDVLAANVAGTSITASYNSTTEVLTLAGSDTLAHYRQVLDSVAFSSTSDNPTDYGSVLSRVLTWTVNDGGGSNNTSAAAFTTVVITAVNDPPTLSNVATVVGFVPQHTITISPAITVSDPDSLTFAGATVKITGGTFAGDGDVLAANVAGTSITSSYNAATETLTLTGIDTPAHYQQVLDSVTFSSGSNPSNGNLNRTRTVTWVVNDGAGSNNLSTAATTTIAIAGSPRNDFDGDNKSDLLLQNNPFFGTPDVRIDLLNGFSIAAAATITTPVGWHVEASGDFNHDNKWDILLQNNDGLPQIWFVNGTSVTSTVALPNPGSAWHVIATGDFDSDGNPDILWQRTDGQPAIWEMNGTSVVGGGLLPNPGTAWHVIGSGDFNGDGKSDILLQNTDGRPAIWDMNGTSIINAAFLVNPGANWHVIGTGDFNGDGKADILWQADNGLPVIWQMNDTTIAGGGTLPNPGTAWHAIGTSDFNGDGLADIVWQNNDGLPAIWEMNGTSIIDAAFLPNPGSTWHIKDDGPIAPDQMASGAAAPQQPVLVHSAPDAANAVPMMSSPDTSQPVLHLSAPDNLPGVPGVSGQLPLTPFSFGAEASDNPWTRQLFPGS